MLFELIPTTRALYVEGRSEAPAVGEFKGVVLAIGLRGSDPVAAASPEQEVDSDADRPEALLGWGTTYFLVADPDRPAPVWVAKNELTVHRVDNTDG